MKKIIILLSILCTALPVFAGDFFGDLFNPDSERYVYSIGNQGVQYAIGKDGKRYVYSIGDQGVQYAIHMKK